MSFDLGPDILFVPADRPERYAKAAERASAIIIDLEDGVAAAARPEARKALIASQLDPEKTIVRINPRGHDDYDNDVNALRQTPYRYVMVPKAASAADVHLVDGYKKPYSVIGLIETADGVLNAATVAADPAVVALMWGAEDLVVSTGGSASRGPDGTYLDLARFARSQVLIAAKAHGKGAIDSVYLDLEDQEGLKAETLDAVWSGFNAKAVLHPAQAVTVRAAYAPTQEQLDWAKGVLAAAEGEAGAFRYEGEMVDEVVLKRARALAALA